MRRRRPAALGAMAVALLLAVSGCGVVSGPEDELAAAGGAALRAGDYAAAEAYFAEALSHDPHDPDILLSLGVIYQNTGRDVLAREIYERLIEDERTEAAAMLLELKSPSPPAVADQARRNLDDLARIDPAPLPPSETAAGEAAPAGEGSEAVPALPAVEEVRQIRDDFLSLHRTLEEVRARLDRYAGVIERLEAAVAPPPPTPPAPAGSPGLAAPDGDLPVKIHIASFRSEAAAIKGWEILQSENADLLGALALDIKEIDLGPGMGLFYRVRAAPVASEAQAKQLCAALKARGLYCSVAYF